MDLQSYLDRIHFEGEPKADPETLIQLHRRHLLGISYENIDVQLRRPVDLDIRRIYTKIVEQGRGGWCYEMNGLMEWALTEIGFDVTRVNGGVMRAVRGDEALGNHLVLLVELDRTWLVDVGFGDGILDPVPLMEGPVEQRGFHYRLERLADGFWRFHNHDAGGAPSFDFFPRLADEALFREKCDLLQTAETSSFVMNLVCQRFVEDGYQIQLGRVAKQITPRGTRTRVLNSEGELLERLRLDFDLDVPELGAVWPRIVARHEAMFGE
jgi:N-hydroxyarylamine O-acetyltransferase